MDERVFSAKGLPPGVALIDLETRKVPAPRGFRMPNGEALKRRWSVFAAGVAVSDWIYLVWGDDEEALLGRIGELLDGSNLVGYFATRQFDEMICRGRFTNARRAHLPLPTFPAVPGAEEFDWVNMRNLGMVFPERPGEQIASRDVPKAWDAGRREEVLEHLLWDVEALIQYYGGAR